MRGGEYCRSHLPDAEEAEHERRLRAEQFAARVRGSEGGDLVERVVGAVMQAIAAEQAEEGDAALEGEIGALRLVLSRVIAVDALAGEPRDLALTVTRLVDAIVRAIKARHGLVPAETDALDALTVRVLDELDARDAGEEDAEWTDA
jgi:hypothetical protein